MKRPIWDDNPELSAEAQQQRDERKPNGSDKDAEELGEWDFGAAHITAADIPPRGWLLGNLLCRQFLASLQGDGAVGKTALRIACALSLATGRNLIGEHVFARCRVLYLCFEDGETELKRRIFAAMKHYGIADDDIEGRLFVRAISNSEWKLATSSDFGTPEVGPLLAMLDGAIVRRKIGAVFLDPFIKTHSLPENDNNALDFVATMLANLAVERDVSIDTPLHTRKGAADPGNADAGRGASSYKDAGRLVYTLCVMSKDEAKLFGIPEGERRRLIRMDSGKVNIAPPSGEAKWLKLVGVPIGNCSERYPAGDEIQVVESWTPPDTWAGVPNDVANDILTDIDAGLPDGQRYSSANAAKSRAAWGVVAEHCPIKSEAMCRKIISTWVENKVLVEREYEDPIRRRKVTGLFLDPLKRPG